MRAVGASVKFDGFNVKLSILAMAQDVMTPENNHLIYIGDPRVLLGFRRNGSWRASTHSRASRTHC